MRHGAPICADKTRRKPFSLHQVKTFSRFRTRQTRTVQRRNNAAMATYSRCHQPTRKVSTTRRLPQPRHKKMAFATFPRAFHDLITCLLMVAHRSVIQGPPRCQEVPSCLPVIVVRSPPRFQEVPSCLPVIVIWSPPRFQFQEIPFCLPVMVIVI